MEAINIKVRANQEKARAEEEARDYQNQYDTLTSEIEDIRQKKRDLLLGANLPLPGLSVEDGELVYMGKPWDCMSGSDQLKVSAAIVRAIKPQCGFVLLDTLEQMDPDTLRSWGPDEAEACRDCHESSTEDVHILIERICEGDTAQPRGMERGSFK
ncbi:MAG: hypothetical protein ACLVKN_21285 [Flavonifractor plautii]